MNFFAEIVLIDSNHTKQPNQFISGGVYMALVLFGGGGGSNY